MRGSYPLGTAQWRVLHHFLDDGGDLTTAEVAALMGWPMNRTLRTLRSLCDRSLLESERAGRSLVWRLRVHGDSDTNAWRQDNGGTNVKFA